MREIIFSKPDINDLNEQGYKCVDMHFHTVYSDGSATVEEILAKIRKLNIGVSIADHNEIKGCLEIAEKKTERYFIIPGIEVKSRELIDILFYFYEIEELKRFFDNEVLPNTKKFFHISRTNIPLSKLIKLHRKYNCLISVAHPFGYSLRSSLTEVFKKFKSQLEKSDVFEAINGGNTRKQNEKVINYIVKNNKAFTAGSDGHSIYPLGNVLTCSKAKNIKEFLDNIKTKKNIVIGMETRFGKIGEYGYYGIDKIKNFFKR